MYKKIILGLVTFSLAGGAYLLLSSGDRPAAPPTDREASDAVRRFVSLPTTQPAGSITDTQIPFRRPGDRTLARVYDDVTGRLRYQFEARKWEPVSDTDFHVEELLIQIYTDRGEITYISADTADVTIARKSGNRLEPKRGRLQGNVKLVIDRTTTQWREAHPDLADRYAHADELINIDLQDARFDLDRAELQSEGSILVDSQEVRIENVEGLTLQWNQTDNRIDMLSFKRGGRMLLRRGGKVIDFAMPGTERSADPGSPADKTAPAEAAPPARQFDVPRAQAMKPMSIEAVTAVEAAAEIRLEAGIVVANQPKALEEGALQLPAGGRSPGRLRSPQTLAADMQALKAEARAGTSGQPIPLDDLVAVDTDRRKRVHTYRAVFENQVVVEQKEGLRTRGLLAADRLEINFDFGSKLRSIASPRPRKQDASPTAGSEPAPGQATPAGQKPKQPPLPLEEDHTRLILTWNGPLEMRPLRVDPDQQTGERFDVIASGTPVRVETEQVESGPTDLSGSRRAVATCDQLVYRHERRQVWLVGSESRPAVISVGQTRRLTGREVFFDQQRGLARVDGAGSMISRRSPVSDHPKVAVSEETANLASATWGRTADFVSTTLGRSAEPLSSTMEQASDGASSAGGEADRREATPVEIHWSRGVDIELGFRTVRRKNPSTGLQEDKRREFLQRAWFHGDVTVRQGRSHLSAEEVAATFGVSASSDDLADHIQHLSMSGDVRLLRDDDLIAAQRLDVEMTVTREGNNVPRVVDGSGNVVVRQGASEFRADQMYAVLASGFDGSRLGIESMNASGAVYVSDAEHNLKIRGAQTLECRMRGGNELVQATIVSPDPTKYARARYGEVAVHGHRIEIDMDREFLSVPGPGKTWLKTSKDFGGRKLSRPTPVKITWSDRMQLRMDRDYALFFGNVRTVTGSPGGDAGPIAQAIGREFASACAVATAYHLSAPLGRLLFGVANKYRYYGRLSDDIDTEPRTFSLDCDKLTVRFARVPPKRQRQTKKAYLDRLFNLGPIVGAKPPGGDDELVAFTRERKRPAYVVAQGHARALNITRAPSSPRGLPGRLLNRLLIQGDRIEGDLDREQMSVPGAGALLIEDYRFDPSPPRRRTSRRPSRKGPLMSAVGNEGPSQTAISWKNSMDFFVDRNLVAFDREVAMVHRSGLEMVLQGELATALNTDPETLRHLGGGRRATLSCGYLLLEFLGGRGSPGPAAPGMPMVRATDLKRLIAKHAVTLQEGSKSLMGEHLQYMHETDEVRLEGSDQVEARIIDQDELSQRFNMWRGPLLVWNRKTNRIEAPGATVRTSRR